MSSAINVTLNLRVKRRESYHLFDISIRRMNLNVESFKDYKIRHVRRCVNINAITTQIII